MKKKLIDLVDIEKENYEREELLRLFCPKVVGLGEHENCSLTCSECWNQEIDVEE